MMGPQMIVVKLPYAGSLSVWPDQQVHVPAVIAETIWLQHHQKAGPNHTAQKDISSVLKQPVDQVMQCADDVVMVLQAILCEKAIASNPLDQA